MNKVFAVFFITSATLIMSRGLFTFVLGGAANFLAAAAFFLPCLGILLQSKMKLLTATKLNLAILIFLTYLFFLIFAADGLLRGFLGFALFALYYVLYLSISISQFDEKTFYKHFNFFMLFLFVLIAGSGVLEVLLREPFSTLKRYTLHGALQTIYGNNRLSGFIGSTLPYGVVLSYLSIFLFAKLMQRFHIGNCFLVLLSLFLLFGTYNRGAIGMTLIGYSVLIFRSVVSLATKTITPSRIFVYSLAILAMILVLGFAPDAVHDRIFAIFDMKENSNSARLGHWLVSLGSLETWEQWFTGLSLGATGNLLTYFQLDSLTGSAVTESYYLKLLVETGVIGLVLFLSILIISIYNASNLAIQRKNYLEASTHSFLFAVLIAQGCQLAFLQSLESTSVAFMFFMTLGVCAQLMGMQRKVKVENLLHAYKISETAP